MCWLLLSQAPQLWHRSSAALRHVGSSLSRDRTRSSCIGRQILHHWAARESLWYFFLVRKLFTPFLNEDLFVKIHRQNLRILCAWVLSCFSRVQLCVTPWTAAHRFLCPWDFLGKKTGVGCHGLPQGIFPTRGLNQRRSPELAGGFFTTGATWEVPISPDNCFFFYFWKPMMFFL